MEQYRYRLRETGSKCLDKHVLARTSIKYMHMDNLHWIIEFCHILRLLFFFDSYKPVFIPRTSNTTVLPKLLAPKKYTQSVLWSVCWDAHTEGLKGPSSIPFKHTNVAVCGIIAEKGHITTQTKSFPKPYQIFLVPKPDMDHSPLADKPVSPPATLSLFKEFWYSLASSASAVLPKWLILSVAVTHVESDPRAVFNPNVL